MSLELLLEPATRSVTFCKVGQIVASLEEPYKSALIDTLARGYREGGLSDLQVARRMASAGLPVGERTVSRHRAGACVCVVVA